MTLIIGYTDGDAAFLCADATCMANGKAYYTDEKLVHIAPGVGMGLFGTGPWSTAAINADLPIDPGTILSYTEVCDKIVSRILQSADTLALYDKENSGAVLMVGTNIYRITGTGEVLGIKENLVCCGLGSGFAYGYCDAKAGVYPGEIYKHVHYRYPAVSAEYERLQLV